MDCLAKEETMTRDTIDPKADDNSQTSQRPSERETPVVGHVPKNIKDSKAAQFEYGRRSQHATEHFDRTSRRLEHGNPDVGEVDLGNIEADKPAEPDDNDHYD